MVRAFLKLTDVKIDPRKLAEYLLVWREEDDKSGYLALAGFTQDSTADLMAEPLRLAADVESETERANAYGELLRADGPITGPNGRTLAVRTIWIKRRIDGETHFVTLAPLETKQ